MARPFVVLPADEFVPKRAVFTYFLNVGLRVAARQKPHADHALLRVQSDQQIAGSGVTDDVIGIWRSSQHEAERTAMPIEYGLTTELTVARGELRGGGEKGLSVGQR